MANLRPKIVEADACVVGGANYYSMLNGLTHSFLDASTSSAIRKEEPWRASWA